MTEVYARWLNYVTNDWKCVQNHWSVCKMIAVRTKLLKYVPNDWNRCKMTHVGAKWLKYDLSDWNMCKMNYVQNDWSICKISVEKWVQPSTFNLGSKCGRVSSFQLWSLYPGEEPPAAIEQKAAWDLQPIGLWQWRNIFAPLINLTPFWNPLPHRHIQIITPLTFTQNHTTPTTHFTLILSFYIPLTSFPVVLLLIRVLFIHKILFSSTCFEHQVLIFRRT